MRSAFFKTVESKLARSSFRKPDRTTQLLGNPGSVAHRRNLLCEALEGRLLLTASLEQLFNTDLVSDESVQRTIVPGELVVAYHSGQIQKESNPLPTLTSELSRSLTRESQVLGRELLRSADVAEPSVDLFHFRFDTDQDLLELANRASNLPGVAWVAPNYQYSGDLRDFIPNDPLFGAQYHHSLIGSQQAWDVTLGDPSVVIAITDDGVELNHPDLAANIWQNTAEVNGIPGVDDDNNGFVDDINGWDFSSGDNNPSPNGSNDDHGTHVAGIAAAVTNNNNQVAGVAGGSLIMPLRIRCCSSSTSTIMASAFAYAIDNGAKIANTSYNINGFAGDPTFTAGLQYYHDNGGIHFNSAGNGNELNPARQIFEQTILVASTTSSDSKSGFSNYGTGIDIAAPGSSIRSTIIGGGTGLKSGTSMAAPNAAGAAALVWSANPSWTRDQVIAYLLATADNIDANNPNYVGLLGSGRINVSNLNGVLAPPQVAAVSGLPANGASADSNSVIDRFELRFDQLMDLSETNDLANFSLAEAGPNGIAGDSDDIIIPITPDSTYMIGSNDHSFTIDDGALGIGKYVLTVSAGLTNPFGTALDGNGDGSGGDAFQTFFDVVAPPFAPVAPEGSLIYDLSINGVISASGETDSYSFDLESGQQLTIIAEPDTGLTPVIDVIGPGGSIGAGSAVGTGQDLVLQSLAIATPGTYSIEVGGDSGTTGAYALELMLNAAAESETFGGAANDTLASAQDLDATSIGLGFGTADRLAVVGQLPSASGSDWYRFSTSPSGSNSLALTRLGSGNATLELYDSGGNLIAGGVNTNNADQVISQYLTTASSTHYARVFGTDAAYSLLLTRNSDFDRENNDNGLTQDLSQMPSATVMGAIFNSIIDGVEPDDYTNQTILDAINPAVALSNNIGGGSIYAAEATSFDPPTGVRVFAPSPTGAAGFRENSNELRADFASPTNFVSIDVGSDDNSDISVLQAFAADGTMLDEEISLVVTDGNFRTLSIFRTSPDIAYAVAFGLGGDVSPMDNLRFGRPNVEDFYTVDVVAGELLSVETSTPGSGTFQPNNLVDPGIELFDPLGNPITHNNVTGDESLTHLATETGQYTVRVFAEENEGAYVLNISGRSATPSLFEVSATNPFDGEVIATSPTDIVVDFDSQLLLTTVDASDLTIDGTAATGVTIVDGDTLSFQIGPLNHGPHTIQIAAGAITNLQGVSLEPFSSQFELDTIAPRVISSSIQENDILPVGSLSYTVQFDQELNAANLDESDISLIDDDANSYAPTNLNYSPGTSSLTVDFADLPEGRYTMTLFSGDGMFEDLAGNDLDGEPVAFPLPPNVSGNGVAGGDFSVSFDVDFDTMPFALPLASVLPLGSLVFEQTASQELGFAGDVDAFTIDVDNDQTISVILETETGVTGRIDVLDPGGATIASETASVGGEDLVAQLIDTGLTGAGTYEIQVSAASGVGDYTLRLLLNAAVETEKHDGATNDTSATAQDIDPSAVQLGFGSSERLAVIGQLPTSGSGEDWYSFTSSTSGSNTLALTRLGSGSATLELYDNGGNLLTNGVPSDNADQVISQYLTTVPSTHFVRVFGTDAAYSLLITGDGDFDREANDGGISQDLSPLPNATVLGAITATNASDEYTFAVNIGDELTISTLTPGSGALQPINLLDPGIELLDPADNPISYSNVVGNELLSYTAAVTGTYKVRVFSESDIGAYVLNIAGRNASLPAFDVVSTDPFDGQLLSTAPTEIVVDFSSPLLLTSADATDLTVNGNPATSVSVVDEDTLRFQIGAVESGTHTIQIAAGALTNLQGAAVETFLSQFDVTIAAPPIQVLDNGDAGYSTVGANWFPGSGFGYEGDFDLSPAGSGSQVAEWVFSDLTPGLYRVSATWLGLPDLATNAPFTILDGSSPLTTVNMNQQLDPADFTYQDTNWDFLGGVHRITGDSLVVQLGDAADNTVLADAIHIEQIPGNIIDNGDLGYSVVGTGWQTSASGFGFDGDIDLHSAGSGSDVARWTFSGLTPGNYRVSASWFPIPTLATDAPFTIFDGTTTLSTVNVNQQVAPSTTREGGVLWEQLGSTYTITGTELVVELSNLADGIVSADAIHIEHLTGTVIDDSESGYSTNGGWFPLAIGLGFGFDGDFDVGEAGTGAEIATWTFSGLTPGQFRVSATWLPLSGLATNAPFTILDGASPVGTTQVDLTEQPNDLATRGAFWHDLGDSYLITKQFVVGSVVRQRERTAARRRSPNRTRWRAARWFRKRFVANAAQQ